MRLEVVENAGVDAGDELEHEHAGVEPGDVLVSGAVYDLGGGVRPCLLYTSEKLKQLFGLFGAFAVVGVTTFGGGYAMLPALQLSLIHI